MPLPERATAASACPSPWPAPPRTRPSCGRRSSVPQRLEFLPAGGIEKMLGLVLQPPMGERCPGDRGPRVEFPIGPIIALLERLGRAPDDRPRAGCRRRVQSRVTMPAASIRAKRRVPGRGVWIWKGAVVMPCSTAGRTASPSWSTPASSSTWTTTIKRYLLDAKRAPDGADHSSAPNASAPGASPPKRRSRRWKSAIAPASASASKSGHIVSVNHSSA
jgi:hypothetical protein